MSLGRRPIGDLYVSTRVLESEGQRPGGAAGADDDRASVFEIHTVVLEGTEGPGHVGVVSHGPVLSEIDRVDRPDPLDLLVRLGELEGVVFERQRDGQTVDTERFRAAKRLFDPIRIGLEGDVLGVDSALAEGGFVHRRRQ